MEKTAKKRVVDIVSTIVMFVCLILTVVLEWIDVPFTDNELYNQLLSSTAPMVVGFIAIVILSKQLGFHLLKKPEKLLYLLPCMLVAINNFPFYSFFAGNMSLREGVDGAAWIFFAFFCLMTGFFEEFIFRGVLFPVIAERTPDSKKGLFFAVLLSSVVFGLSHLLNLFKGAGFGSTLLQVGYSTLTGGMFVFALIKTKNILASVLLHAVYNFGGMVFMKEQGLGNGVVFDVPTAIIMAVVAVAVAIFVIIKIFTYSDEERRRLYQTLGIKHKKQQEKTCED